MPEDDGPAEPAVPDAGDQGGEGLRRVDRIHEHALGPGQEPGRFPSGEGGRSVAVAELLAVDLDGAVAGWRLETGERRQTADDPGDSRRRLRGGRRDRDTQDV